jgi:alpha-tubulin suppressor-like RCC1 family protein
MHNGGQGQLGTGLGLAVDMYAMQSVPEPIDTDELSNRKVIKIAAGHSHAAAITESGELFKWGMAVDLEPRRVDAMVHTRVVDVFCGEDYTLALDKDGHLYSFGQGKAGTLGAGSPKYLNTATLMEFFDKREVLSASAGWKHAGCLVRDRVV